MNKNSVAVMNWRNRAKLKLIELKGGRCEMCGYNKMVPSVFEFHHPDPKAKDFQISAKTSSFESLKREAEKCMLLCANCHAELHWNLLQEVRQARLAALETRGLADVVCPWCKAQFHPRHDGQIYCTRNCADLARRNGAERPSRETLEEDIRTMTWAAMGKKYGVSDNAVRKWARKYELYGDTCQSELV